MADIRVTQGYVLSVLDPDNSDNLKLTQGAVLVIYTKHSVEARTTQGFVNSLLGGTFDLRTTQARVLVLWRGRRENRKLRAWPFSLDGHDFYVLRLGEDHTMVLDLSTGQWSRWATPDMEVWRAHLGLNWQGIGETTLDNSYSWNVVGGDDDQGVLWLADPTYSRDTDLDGVDISFDRQALGMVPMRLREGKQCGGIYVIGSVGNPALTGDQITLKTSDDNGHTWIDHGGLTVTASQWDQEVSWLGLGLITAPGRMFLLEDNGAFARISSMDMR